MKKDWGEHASKRAILTPLNEMVDKINHGCLEKYQENKSFSMECAELLTVMMQQNISQNILIRWSLPEFLQAN